ncbi:hypothetical protein BS47DRAFT_1363868 [Hydnum rufescens UP504]|uniref:Uncharacterized protein n=1 Tax=Hydnum rufescens UP504 TaxID=1448309 RepID=A0A9P6ASX5_9AGAM|nr:hypothetical protein BS47DRAFT_1363868 [Hydnum rufescens UP504]
MGPVENHVDLSSTEQFCPPSDSMNPCLRPPTGSFRGPQRSTPATHFFEKHLFDIRKISTVSVIASITTQACTVIIVITLSYAMQLVASDTIVRRTLHGNLAAWRGLGSSILALWRSQDLDVHSQLHIFLAFAFFGAVSVLHIVMPSVITIGTFNSHQNISLEVSTVLNITKRMWSYASETSEDPFAVIPYLLPQLGTSTNPTVGLPPGVNGS